MKEVIKATVEWEDRQASVCGRVTRQDPPSLTQHLYSTIESLTLLLSCSDVPYACL